MGNVYLLFYNASLVSLWGFVLYQTVKTTLEDADGKSRVYQTVELPLKVAQTAAILEVVHSAIGLVRSPVFITATQVASRLWVLWGLVHLVPDATTQGALHLGTVSGYHLQLNLVTLLVAWCTSEVIRYSFYAFKELLGYVPYPSIWLRYTGFIVLYPLGVSSELTMAYLALPTIKTQRLLSFSMPNALNFAFDYHTVCLAVCATYSVGLPTLYKYMLAQRRKTLGGQQKVKRE